MFSNICMLDVPALPQPLEAGDPLDEEGHHVSGGALRLQGHSFPF